jgi:hypothetical protein
MSNRAFASSPAVCAEVERWKHDRVVVAVACKTFTLSLRFLFNAASTPARAQLAHHYSTIIFQRSCQSERLAVRFLRARKKRFRRSPARARDSHARS